MEWKSGARIIIVCGTVGYLWQFAVTYSGPGTILVRSVAGVLGGVGFVLWLESELKRAYSFSPFTVRIETNRAALVDHGLATAEQLDELDESLTDLEGERSALVKPIQAPADQHIELPALGITDQLIQGWDRLYGPESWLLAGPQQANPVE